MLELIASVALAATSATGTPPAPTLIWRDELDRGHAYVRGLTRSGTTVEVHLNGEALPDVRYGASRGGTASFAAQLPELEAGVYEVVATATGHGSASGGSEPLRLVVPGLRHAPPRLA